VRLNSWSGFSEALEFKKWEPRTLDEKLWVHAKIKFLIAEGKSRDQAVAIAYSMAEGEFSKGGPGSGHRGHKGRPGLRGGGLPGDGAPAPAPAPAAEIPITEEQKILSDRIKAGKALSAAAGVPPTIASEKDYPKAVDYISKLNGSLRIQSYGITTPQTVSNFLYASKDFVEKTGLPVPNTTILDTQDLTNRYGYLGSKAAGLYDIQAKRVYLNADANRYPSELQSARNLFVHEPNTNTIQNSVWHEFGHAVHYGGEYDISRLKRLKTPVAYSLEHSDLLKAQGMSKYGMTQKSEFVAEYFTGKMQGKKFGPAVVDRFNKITGSKVWFQEDK
jgi:hypothetical protein